MELTESRSSGSPGFEGPNKQNIFPFLRLSGELRNLVYEHVAADALFIRLYMDRIILPPLACVCRKIRSEMSGKYEEDVVQYPAIPVEAYSTTLNFGYMFRWLDKNDGRSEEHAKSVRALHIHLDVVPPQYESMLSEDHKHQPNWLSIIKKRDGIFEHALASCGVREWASETDEERIDYESILSTLGASTRTFMNDCQLRKYVQTRNGKGYLISCSARTLHGHEFSGSNSDREISSHEHYCHLHDYVWYLITQLRYWRSLREHSAHRFYSVIRTAIESFKSTMCPRDLGRHSPSRVREQPTCLETSLTGLY